MAERPPIALVEWLDAGHLTYGWEDRQAMIDAARRLQATPMYAAGFLLADEPGGVTLALALDTDGDKVGQVMQIPRAAIRRMELAK